MLSPLRRPSPLSSLSQCRTYTTESISPSRSSYRRHDREHIPPHADSRRPYLASQRNQYLFVRLKDGSVVSSMPELLGAVRGLERELGRVKDFQLQRDPYDPTRFLRWFRIRLEDPHYWDTLSETGRTLKLTIPVLPASAASRPGGIGIGDIQGLLDPQEKVEEDFEFGVPGVDVKEDFGEVKEGKGEKEEGKEGKQGGESVRTVEVSINRSTRKDPEQPTFLISKDRRMRIGQSFVGWGGFYQPSSTPSPSPSSSPTPTPSPTSTSAPASVFEVDGVSVAPTQTRVDKEVPRMAGLKKRYANVAVEEVKRTEEEAEWEKERERERESGEGVLVGGEGQTEQEAVNEQRDFNAILQAFEEAPAELAKNTITSSIPETEDAQHLTSSTPPSPSHSTTETTSIPPSTPTPTHPSTTSKRALRKEKLLELARQNAQQPLPEALKARELDSQVLTEEEKEVKEKEGKDGKGGRQAVRERLWRLMGGLLP